MIKVLDSFVADKIAAGEVIERPASIVKELIENSIDAGSDSIIVEIRNGGKSYIRITDNGCGIPADEVEIAFQRHATGKISTLSDLDNIHTLGFRGEALASISAISRLSIITRTPDSNKGIRMDMHGGKKISSEFVGANIGTSIVIEDVFYNTPARRKFMQSDAREASAIIDIVQKLAIYYSNIRFMLINNRQTVLNTAGNGDYQSTISLIYPGREFKNLIPINGDNIKGFISNPNNTLSNRKGQLFYVNGRIVDSKIIEKGIEEGYGNRIFSGYPVAVLFIELDPDTIDVNIHPGKKEIKFLNQQAVIDLISSAIGEAMKVEASIPKAEYMPNKPKEKAGYMPEDRAEFAPHKKPDRPDVMVLNDFAYKVGEELSPISSPKEAGNEAPESSPKETRKEAPKEARIDIREYLSSIERNDSASDHSFADASSSDSNAGSVSASGPVSKPNTNLNLNPNSNPNQMSIQDIAELDIVGYVFNAYIITQRADAIYVIDQHAAHERIFYEKLTGAYLNEEHKSQTILKPIIIEVSQDIYNQDREWMSALNSMGYLIEDFGSGTFIIKEIPQFMDMGEAHDFANEFINSLGEIKYNKLVVDKLITRSCKSAVKANEKLSALEMRNLLKNLANCENPYSCPHGRPTFIKISKYELERSFKRK